MWVSFMDKTIKILSRLKENKKLEPYLSYIRFPFYRNLERNLRINFDFPVTAIVGQNGTNKSSVLRAIWSCPEGNSLARFWFSTEVDQILEDGGRPRYIYSYYQQEALRDVEVIKMRIHKTDNPEYWEPARPQAGDNMEKMPKEKSFLAGRSKTRWNLMKKEAIYLDFRSEISAFDKYFYHGDLQQTLRHNTKQDVIRNKSKYLKEVISKNLTSKRMYKGNKEHVFKNVLFPAEQLEEVSKILNRNYSEIRLIEHKFFKNKGVTIVFRDRDLNYSEAFAGSGEFSVAILVNRIFKAPKNSLIVLDEPEVSLHPGAQARMLDFLLDRVKKCKHQIIFGTHSPFLIKGLPPGAIKTLFLDPETKKVCATDKTSPDEAFFHLGVTNNNIYNLFSEDRLAAELVEKALRMLGQAKHERCKALYLPGGAGTLLKSYFVPYARTNRRDSLFIMDGDQLGDSAWLDNQDLSRKTDSQLNELLFNIFDGDISLPVDAGAGGKDTGQERDAKIRILNYAKTNLLYLPGGTPESFIWSNMKYKTSQYDIDFDNIECVKSRFEKLCIKELGRAAYESVTSDEIFELQKRCLATVDNSLFEELAEKLGIFIDSQQQ